MDGSTYFISDIFILHRMSFPMQPSQGFVSLLKPGIFLVLSTVALFGIIVFKMIIHILAVVRILDAIRKGHECHGNLWFLIISLNCSFSSIPFLMTLKSFKF